MLKIFIVRHGQNEDNLNNILNGHRDLPLTKLGEEQAANTAEHLRERGCVFDAIYSSPLQRARKTAQIISENLGTHSPIVLDGLIERDFGVMTGLPQSKILELCMPNVIQTPQINYFLCPEGAETFPDLIARAQLLLKQIERMHDSGNILLVTHGDFGKMLYVAFYELDWREVLTSFYFGNADMLELSNHTAPEFSHVCLKDKLEHRYT